MRIRVLFTVLVALMCVTTISAQKSGKKFTITGTVVDVTNEPIVNAMVMIDGENTSAVTDAKGTYKIKVKPSAKTIGIFTFGSGVAEQAIEGRTEINFSFGTLSSQQQSVQNLSTEGEEVVSDGYGTIKKKNVTNEAKSVDLTKENKYATYKSIYELLQREFSGVRVAGNSVSIQGAKNMMGSVPPLFILDGIPVDDISGVNPVYVKTVEVLKGSSAAMYGTRGSGGVIIIKTLRPGE